MVLHKYMNVWSVHESECLELLRNVQTADADIMTKYLGTKNKRPSENSESFRERINEQRPFKNRVRTPSTSQASSPNLQSLDHQNTYKYVLEHLVVITRWLQDNDIQPMLTNSGSAETLIHVDHILHCFGITSMEHLQALVEAFLPNIFDIPNPDESAHVRKYSDV